MQFHFNKGMLKQEDANVPKFAAKLSMLFTKLPFMEWFAAAKAAGFDGVEFPFPDELDKLVLAERVGSATHPIRNSLGSCGL